MNFTRTFVLENKGQEKSPLTLLRKNALACINLFLWCDLRGKIWHVNLLSLLFLNTCTAQVLPELQHGVCLWWHKPQRSPYLTYCLLFLCLNQQLRRNNSPFDWNAIISKVGFDGFRLCYARPECQIPSYLITWIFYIECI